MKNRSIVNNLPNKDSWETPEYILKPLKKEFGKMFDPCPLNHDITLWDGLKINWKKVNFINPPYSRKLKEDFIRKAFNEWHYNDKTCILLLPVSTSTQVFHSYIYGKAEIRFLKGRVKFKGTNSYGKKVSNKCGMHDSMIVIFRCKQ